MQFQIDTPPPMEATKVEVSERGLIVTPHTVKNQHILRVGYLTARGAKGNETRAVVLFNANRGEFSVQRMDGESVMFDFDLDPKEFKTKRTQAKQNNQAKFDKKKDSATPDDGPIAPSQPPSTSVKAGEPRA